MAKAPKTPPPSRPGTAKPDEEDPEEEAPVEETKDEAPAPKGEYSDVGRPLTFAGVNISEEDKKEAKERHDEVISTLKDLKEAINNMVTENKAFVEMMTTEKDAAEAERKEQSDRHAKVLAELANLKVEEKKEDEKKQKGTQAVLDAFKQSGDDQAQFLRKLGVEIMEQNSNQHKATQDAAKSWAKEQVGFNLAGYMDDFSKSLAVSICLWLCA